MKKLKRNINVGFRVNEEERDAIIKRMEMAGIGSLRVYLLKMALMGHIICLDMVDVRECSRLLRIVSNNVNQLAKKANEGGNVYAADVEDVKTQLGGIWDQQEKIIKSLAKILEVAA